MKGKIGVILVNYNGDKYNDKCIISILKSTIKEQLYIIVVDNASTDNSLKNLTEKWQNNSQVQIVALDDNYGFSKANNEGIKAAISKGIDKYLLLNNDTEIEPYTIERMLESQEKTGAIIVPKVFFADKPDTVWCAGGEFSGIIKKPRQIGLNQKDTVEFQAGRYCGFANGCCMLLDRNIVDKIGFLDERFFLYYEDTEYSLRAAKNGIKIWYCAKAIVYHKVNGSTKGNDNPDSAYYITRNWLLCNKLSYGKINWLFGLYFALNRLAWAAIWLCMGKKELVSALWQGICDFRREKFGKREYVK